MPDGLALEFASQSRCSVVAAAGCGKTELIADAVAANPQSRQLVLTHTHAGVRALRNRLRRKSVTPGAFIVDTIAGFALRYSSSFPSLSGCSIREPQTEEDYRLVYLGASSVLGNRHVRKVLAESYDGAYVDEYQDCTSNQHHLVFALADLLPTRIVGDPLQSVFDFRGAEALGWQTDVQVAFPQLCELTTPHRWRNSNPALGQWLVEARDQLLSGGELDFREPCVRWIQLEGDSRNHVRQQNNACQSRATESGESIAVIRKWKNQAHRTAKGLRGRFRSMEEMECRDLMDFCRAVETTTGVDRVLVVLDLVAECVTSQPDWFSRLRSAVARGRLPTRSRIDTSIQNAVQSVAADLSVGLVSSLLQAVKAQPDIKLYRRELYEEAIRTTRNYDEFSGETLQVCAWKTRDRTRVVGRPVDRRVVSRTLLIKGLEFDHAIIVDVDDFNDDSKNLYVALTRGAKSLTVLSRQPVIRRSVPDVET